MPKPNQRRPQPRSIKYDVVDPRDHLYYNHAFACEHCSHFSTIGPTCTLGYNVEPHLLTRQLTSYNKTGKMAFCRFLEID